MSFFLLFLLGFRQAFLVFLVLEFGFVLRVNLVNHLINWTIIQFGLVDSLILWSDIFLSRFLFGGHICLNRNEACRWWKIINNWQNWDWINDWLRLLSQFGSKFLSQCLFRYSCFLFDWYNGFHCFLDRGLFHRCFLLNDNCFLVDYFALRL